MECNEIEIRPVTLGCENVVIIGSPEIYHSLLAIKDIVNRSPVPVSFNSVIENTKTLAESINEVGQILNEFNDAASTPVVNHSVNPYERKYKNKRWPKS